MMIVEWVYATSSGNTARRVHAVEPDNYSQQWSQPTRRYTALCGAVFSRWGNKRTVDFARDDVYMCPHCYFAVQQRRNNARSTEKHARSS